LCSKDQVKAHLMENMNSLGKKEGLFGFELVKDIFVESRSLNDYDCLTTTMKIKRKETYSQFKKQIDTMYVKLN